MKFNQSTVLGFFDSSQKHFIIPVYQRAYSWGKEQWDVFLEDLIEQTNGSNNYFYGNILLETLVKDKQYEIIDGQQRLTTLVIFICSLLKVLTIKGVMDADVESKYKIYLKSGGNIKIRPVEYDRACFDSVVIDGNDRFETSSPSQKRIIGAKKYFEDVLMKYEPSFIISLLDKLETAELTCIELDGKKDSALMFELQNNRGRDLTNMEKIKSYFMYQLYVYSCVDETEINIEYVSNIFKQIYVIINDLKKMNEDSILIYHCNAYIKGYYYRTIEDIKDAYKKSDDKVKWIKDFSKGLYTSFSNMKKFEVSNDKYLQDLRQLSIPAFVYPFIIKGYNYFPDEKEKRECLYNILEVVVFRYQLINSRADLYSRINDILLNFDGDLDRLKTRFKNKFNEAWYWGDHKMKEYLNGYMYENGVLHYLLWRYEASIQRKGYNINSFNIDNEQIEHISPKTPTNGEYIETGYDIDESKQYSDDFINTKLNCLGNLVLISGSHNASIGNKPFSEKLKSFKTNPLLKQQAEISDFTEDDTMWKSNEILTRHNRIVTFAINKWSFDNVKMLSD